MTRVRDQLALGFAFLTRLPVPLGRARSMEALAEAVWCFPLIGAAVGAIVGGVALGAHRIGLSPVSAALLGVAAGALATGAVHEAGLADSVAALAGGTPQRRVAILKEGRLDARGVLALVLSVALRVEAIFFLVAAEPESIVPVLVAVHALARTPLPVLMMLLPRAGGEGTIGVPKTPATATALIFGVGLGLYLLGLERGGIALAIVLTLLVVFGRLVRRRFGGYTGDLLGAAEQMVEIAVLLVAAG